MKYEIEAFLPSQRDIIERYGLDSDGHVQRVVDNTFIHYMKEKMPKDSGIMMANTRNPQGGLVTVEVPYAHYQNEGILYVDPEYNIGAFFNENYGYWSRPGIKKKPSNRKLNYHGGPNRGAHFVERTTKENFKDILAAAQKEIDKL